MSPETFQTQVLLWLGVMVVVIPALGAVIVIGLQQVQRLQIMWDKLMNHDQTLQEVHNQLNGALDRRIEAHVNKAMANASNSTANGNSNPGGSGPGGL